VEVQKRKELEAKNLIKNLNKDRKEREKIQKKKDDEARIKMEEDLIA